MELSTIITIVTICVTFFMGLIAKKVKWFSNRLIPIQNLLIGIIAGSIYFYMTKDINLTIMTVVLGTGGAYDVVSNLNKLFKED